MITLKRNTSQIISGGNSARHSDGGWGVHTAEVGHFMNGKVKQPATMHVSEGFLLIAVTGSKMGRHTLQKGSESFGVQLTDIIDITIEPAPSMPDSRDSRILHIMQRIILHLITGKCEACLYINTSITLIGPPDLSLFIFISMHLRS